VLKLHFKFHWNRLYFVKRTVDETLHKEVGLAMNERFVCYYRVSTAEQGKSGLGLAAQKKTVENYLNGNGHEILGEFTEVESGGNNHRPELAKAIRACRLKKARLIVSKLDRLSRDLGFITELQRSGVPFVVAEMPDATELTVNIYAALAQHERKVIGQRTKDALAALKAKGVKLGNPCLKRGERVPGSGNTAQANLARSQKAGEYALAIDDVILEAKAEGSASLREIAAWLNEHGYKTRRGRGWNAAGVGRTIKRAYYSRVY
jgi:DNA invertase Pin-like site-specific DNA recombinase